MHDDFGVEGLVAVVAQVELVVAQQRVAGDEVMRTRTQVLLEARKEYFGGLRVAADHRAAFENQYAIARLGEVGSTDEAVVSRTRHHIVEALRTGCTRAGLSQHGAGLLWLHSAGRLGESEGRQRRGLHKIAASGRSHC